MTAKWSFRNKRTCEDWLALGNVFHGGAIDMAGLANSHLLWTTWWMGGVALTGVFLGRGALSSEVARAAIVEAGMAGGGSGGRWHRQARHGQWWR
jgi:hypothetical protein